MATMNSYVVTEYPERLASFERYSSADVARAREIAEAIDRRLWFVGATVSLDVNADGRCEIRIELRRAGQLYGMIVPIDRGTPPLMIAEYHARRFLHDASESFAQIEGEQLERMRQRMQHDPAAPMRQR